MVRMTEQVKEAPEPTGGKQPLEKFRDGAVQIALWQHEGKNGPFHTMTIQVSRQVNGEWKNTSVSLTGNQAASLDKIFPDARDSLEQRNRAVKQTPQPT
jgi:hypothetical protein